MSWEGGREVRGVGEWRDGAYGVGRRGGGGGERGGRGGGLSRINVILNCHFAEFVHFVHLN